MSSSPPKRASASRRACWGEGPAAEARTRLMTTSTRPAGFMEAPISSRSWSRRRTPTGSAPPTTRMTSACDTRSAVTAPRPGSRVKSSTSSSAGPPATSTTVQAAARRHCAHTSVIEAGGSSRQRPDLPRPPSRKSPSPTGARIRRKLSASRRPWVARRAAPARAEESSGMPRSWTRLGASTSASTRIAPPQAARPWAREAETVERPGAPCGPHTRTILPSGSSSVRLITSGKAGSGISMAAGSRSRRGLCLRPCPPAVSGEVGGGCENAVPPSGESGD